MNELIRISTIWYTSNMKKFFLIFFSSFLGLIGVHAVTSSFLPDASYDGKLAMQNRVLMRVGEETITVLDVMQKMTLFLQRNYPDQVTSSLARSQFFISNWRPVLMEMINQELILADARHLELKISDKEVREEMLARFGPNRMQTLDTLGLSFEKAKEITHNEMMIERMSWFRVHSKAQELITPKHIKLAYKDYVSNNPPTCELEYQVLSIRSQNRKVAQTVAETAFTLLNEKKADFSTLLDLLPKNEDVTVTISDPYHVQETELSKTHKAVLSSLTPGSISLPSSQVSRFDNSEVFRVFFLKAENKTTPRTFEEMENELRQELFGRAVAQKTEEYVAKLRKQYGYDDKHLEEMVPDNFQPFSMQ